MTNGGQMGQISRVATLLCCAVLAPANATEGLRCRRRDARRLTLFLLRGGGRGEAGWSGLGRGSVLVCDYNQ